MSAMNLLPVRFLLTVAVLLCSLVMLTTCEQGVTGIYADINRSSNIARPNSGDRGYPSSMILHNGRYYATAKRLFVRDRNAHGRDWGEIGLPGGYDIAVAVRSVSVGAGGFLVVALTSSASGNSALYELRVEDGGRHRWGENLYRCDQNSDGACVSASGTSLKTLSNQIVWMGTARFASGDPRLFILTKGGANPRSYALYYYNTGGDVAAGNDRLYTVWNPIPLIIDVDTIVSGSRNHIIFADRTNLYCLTDDRGSGAGVSSFSGLNANPVAEGSNQSFELRTLVVDGGADSDPNSDSVAGVVGGLLVQDNTVHVSTGRGQIFRYRERGGSGGDNVCQTAWKGNCSPITATGTGDNTANCWSRSSYAGSYRYTDMVWLNQLASTTVGGMAIGVEEAAGREGGYRRIARAGEVNIAGLTAESISDPSISSNYRSSKLSLTTVRSFFVDNVNDTEYLFALTDGYGIWRATYANGLLFWSVDLSR